MDRHGSSVTESHRGIQQPVAAGERGPLATAALLAIPIAFLAVFFVYPVATIIITGLRPEGSFELGRVWAVVTDPIVGRVAWFTLWQAALSTVLTLVLALPGAYALSRMRFAGRDVVRSAIMVPFVLPTVVVASAFLALLGPHSPINTGLQALFGSGFPTLDLRRTITAILIAHAFFNYAVVVRTVGGLWSLIDPRIEDAARSLGASHWQAFREVTLPLLRPAISSAASIVFLFTFTSFGVVLLLGGPTRATIEVEIHRATTQLLNLPLASILALLQLVAVVSALVVYSRLQRRAVRQPLVASEQASRPPRTPGERWFLRSNLALMALLLAAPLLVLIERSFATADGYSLANYRALFATTADTILAVPPLVAIRNSVLFALLAALVAVVVGGLAATGAVVGRARIGRLVDGALMVPLGTSAVTIGFGFLIALDRPPLDLRGSPWLIPLAQALVATPFVVRTLLPVLRSIDQRLHEAAATLGATPRRIWREVDLPIVGRALLVAIGFSFAIAVGEFGATVFVAQAQFPTMPVAIYRLLGRPGVANFGQAMAMSTILMVVTASALLLIDRLRVGQIGRF